MRIAYLCEPQFGGTFTFFRRVRPALKEMGVEFRCVPPYPARHFAGSPFEYEEGVDYLDLPGDPCDLSVLGEASRRMIEHLVEEKFDAVLILPGCDILTTNLARYLPRSVRCAARVSLMSRATYVRTRAVAPHLNLIFAVSHRVQRDLATRFGVPAELIRVVYNGARIRPCVQRERGETVRLIYTGRLSDVDKGVMQLPTILRDVLNAGVRAVLTIVGSGPDEQRLRSAFERLGVASSVRFVPNQPLAEIERLLDESDIFLLPSRLEACPNALLQAMAAGCAPVAFRIRDSVDRIIEDGVQGLLVPPGDTKAFARAVTRLAQDAELREQVGAAARQRVEQHFSVEHTARLYAEGFQAMLEIPDNRPPPLPLEAYHVPRALEPTWRRRIPTPVKNALRKWMERFGWTA